MSKPWLKLSDIKTARWTKAGNGRLIPLNSAAWGKLRRSVLDGEPLCRMHFAMGEIVVATDVDHINNDPSDNRMESLQALCHECHSRKTARDMGGNVRMGCDKDGKPLDQGHHWNNAPTGHLTSRGGTVAERSLGTDGAEPYVFPLFNAICENEA